MALKEHQQILEAIRRSSAPLIIIPAGAGPDGYASALGFYRVLNKLDTKAEIAAADGLTPSRLSFLQDHDKIGATIENLRKFVIEVDTSKTELNEVSHDHNGSRLRLYLSPRQGFWSENDVRISNSEYKHDLLICLGANDLEACSHLYDQNPDFFFRTPIINIDHSPSNEHFGQMNMVDLTASAVGEVCHDLIFQIEPELIDEEAATAFLTGMIAKTRSFKSPNVTPKTLQTASRLISRGARRDMIVQHLYRTRSVETLRLWGRALARLKQDERSKLVWTMLTRQDFMHAGGEENDLPDVIEELISSSPDAKLVLLLYEDEKRNICGILRTERPFDAIELASPFKPSGTREEARMYFTGKNIVQIEKMLIPKIKELILDR